MDPKALATVPDIIKAASTSPLGILALLILILGLLALRLFRGQPKYRLAAFICFFGAMVGFGAYTLWLQHEDAAQALAQVARVRDLRLHLLFAGAEAANPMRAAVYAYRQRLGQSAEDTLSQSVQTIRGAGGVMLAFDELHMGDRLYVVVRDHGKEWRSDDMRVLEAQLAMNLNNPSQP